MTVRPDPSFCLQAISDAPQDGEAPLLHRPQSSPEAGAFPFPALGRSVSLSGEAHVYFGGCRPREFRQPFNCEPLSRSWARRISRSRLTPGGVPRASLRSLAASSESRCLSVFVLSKS